MSRASRLAVAPPSAPSPTAQIVTGAVGVRVTKARLATGSGGGGASGTAAMTAIAARASSAIAVSSRRMDSGWPVGGWRRRGGVWGRTATVLDGVYGVPPILEDDD